MDRKRLTIKLMLTINELNEEIVNTPMDPSDALTPKIEKLLKDRGDSLEAYKFAAVKRLNEIALRSINTLTDEEFIKFYNENMEYKE